MKVLIKRMNPCPMTMLTNETYLAQRMVDRPDRPVPEKLEDRITQVPSTRLTSNYPSTTTPLFPLTLIITHVTTHKHSQEHVKTQLLCWKLPPSKTPVSIQLLPLPLGIACMVQDPSPEQSETSSHTFRTQSWCSFCCSPRAYVCKT